MQEKNRRKKVKMLQAAVVLLILYIIYFLSIGRFRRSKGLTGPSIVPFYGHYLDFKNSSYQLHLLIHRYYTERAEKVFSFFHYSKEAIVIRQNELIQNVLVNKADKFKNRQFFLDLPWPCEFMITMIKGGPAHKYIRTLLSTLTTTASLKKFAHHVFKAADYFVMKVNDAANEESIIDVESYSGGYIMQILSSLSFSLDNPNQSELNKSLIKLMKSFTNPPRWVHIVASLPFGDKIVGYFHGAHKKQLLPLIETALGLVKERRKEKNASSREDILQILLDIQASNTNGGISLTDEILLAQALVLLTAVQAQTSYTLSTVLYNIAKYKDVQKKLQNEIDEIVNEASFPTWEHLTTSATGYMDNVIRESQRMNPAIFVLMRECTESCKIMDQHFDEGDTVLIPTYSIHRDETNFKNPNEFNPDRFNENENEKNLLTFGNGPRQCTGSRLANVEIKVVLAKLLSKFSFELVNPEQEIKSVSNVTIQANMTITEPINVKVKKR